MIEKITLLCGSLERGTNGVGDYGRLLAQAFSRQGTKVQLISLSDRHVDLIGRGKGIVRETEAEIEILRLSKDLPQTTRLAELKQALDAFSPNLVSLQYVLTSFHPKGMPWGFNRELARLLKPYQLHIMLHETWFGLDEGARLSQRVYGVVQRAMLFFFLRKAQPNLLSLSNPYYQELLSAGGFSSNHFPIFATIPSSAPVEENWLSKQLLASGISQPENFLKFGFFGGIFPNTPGPVLLERAKSLADSVDKKALILAAGRGGAGKYLFQQWAQENPEMVFLELGTLPDQQVYSYLKGLDYGLTGYPHYLLGKSSQVAAMLQAGLPVITGWQGRPLAADPLPPKGMKLILRADQPLESWPKDWSETLPRGVCSVASADDIAAEMTTLLS